MKVQRSRLAGVPPGTFLLAPTTQTQEFTMAKKRAKKRGGKKKKAGKKKARRRKARRKKASRMMM
jgi:hypothetical protein